MSYPEGIRVKVFVFILPENNAIMDSRERQLNKCRPDTVLRGSKTQCGKEWIRQMVDRGFYGDRPVDWLGNVTKAVFGKDISLQASLSFRKILSEEMEKTTPEPHEFIHGSMSE